MPFDIGYSFVNYRCSNQQDKERIISELENFCKDNGYDVFEAQISKCFFNVKFSKNPKKIVILRIKVRTNFWRCQ